MTRNLHRKRFASKSGLMIGAALSAGYALPAMAQAPSAADASEEEAPGSEIVVTARKRSERLSDVPESIAAFSGDTLTRNAVTTINDLGRQTPGLTLTRRQDNTANVVLRGVGSLGSVQGVGFYIDEVQNFTDTTARLEDIGHVEILKGPQGTLYGGSTIGGAIRYVAKIPDFEQAGQIKVEMGERNYQDVFVALNIPIVDQKVAARIAGSFTHDDGYLPNRNLGGVPNSEMREFAAKGQLLLKPTEDLTALFTLRYRRTTGAYGSYTRNNNVQTPNYESNTSFIPNSKITTWAGIANLTYDFGGAALTSITSYTQQNRIVATDADYTSTAFALPSVTQLAGYTDDKRPTKILTQELRLTSETQGRFDWIAGLYAARIDNLTVQGTNGGLSINNGPVRPYLERTTRQDDVAAFGTANMHFGGLTVGGGLRLLHTKYNYTPMRTNGVVQNPIVTQSVAFTAVLPKLSVSYKVDGGPLIYGSVAEGWESGKISIDASVPRSYKPEKAWTGELGIKGEVFGNLNYELAAYYTRYLARQIQTRTLDPVINVVIERVDNIGTSINKGLEASLAWTPVQNLSLNAAGGYLDAQWKKGSFSYAEAGTRILRTVDLAGKQVPNAPHWTLNFGGTYTLPISNTIELELHGDASYNDSFIWRLTPTGPSNINPAYWVSNVRAALRQPDGNWEFAARIENLFDVRYFTEFAPQYFGVQNADGNCNGCHLGSVSSPRRFVASAMLKF